MPKDELSKDVADPAQIGELLVPIMKESLQVSKASAQYWISRKTQLAKAYHDLINGLSPKTAEEFYAWDALYRDIDMRYAGVIDPYSLPPEKENTWLVIALAKLSANELLDALRRVCRFNLVDVSSDLLHVSMEPLREGNLIRRFPISLRLSQMYDHLSVSDIERMGLLPRAMTFKERILLEMVNAKMSHGQLDTDTWTLCAGPSKAKRILGVHWNESSNTLVIESFSANAVGHNLGVRVAV